MLNTVKKGRKEQYKIHVHFVRIRPTGGSNRMIEEDIFGTSHPTIITITDKWIKST